MIPVTSVAGNTEHTQPENRAFFPALDGFRALAFLLVFLQHYHQVPWGWSGVNLFFVLSGFLITGILFDTRDAAHRARNFYIRRTLRIFPLYYAIFLGLLLLYPVMHWQWSLAWLAWPLYVANFLRFLSPATRVLGSSQELSADAHLGSPLMPNTQIYLGHFWSLCVEEQFYLIWPWLVFWLRSRRALLWVCAGAVLFLPILRYGVQSTAPRWMLDSELLYRLLPFQVDALLLGGLVALLWRGPHRERLLLAGKILISVMSLSALAYLALTLHILSPHPFIGYRYPAWKFTWGLTFIDFLAASLLICLLRPQGLLYRIFNLRPLRWVGRLSYGAYVFHDALHSLYAHIVSHVGVHYSIVARHTSVLVSVLALCSTLTIAWFSFRFFEGPFLNLKERWTHR